MGKASDYTQKMNQVFGRFYGGDDFGHQKHPEGIHCLGQWLLKVDPDDTDLVEVMNKGKFGRSSYIQGQIVIEIRYVELNGYNNWFGQDHAIIVTGTNTKTIQCKTSIRPLFPDTKTIKVSAYMDGQLIIEQFAIDEVRPTHVVEGTDGSGKAKKFTG